MPRSHWRLKHLRAEHPPQSQHPDRFSGQKPWESGNVFVALSLPSEPHDQRITLLYEWELLIACRRHLIVLICHVILLDQSKGWVGANEGNLPSAMFGSHKHCGIGVLKEFLFLTMIAMKMGENESVSVIVAAVANKNKILHQKYECFTFELSRIKLSWLAKYKATKNAAISKRYIFSKKVQKFKKKLLYFKNIVIFQHCSITNNFVLKIEANWDERLG